LILEIIQLKIARIWIYLQEIDRVRADEQTVLRVDQSPGERHQKDSGIAVPVSPAFVRKY
jgi:hypothetical protein